MPRFMPSEELLKLAYRIVMHQSIDYDSDLTDNQDDINFSAVFVNYSGETLTLSTRPKPGVLFQEAFLKSLGQLHQEKAYFLTMGKNSQDNPWQFLYFKKGQWFLSCSTHFRGEVTRLNGTLTEFGLSQLLVLDAPWGSKKNECSAVFEEATQERLIALLNYVTYYRLDGGEEAALKTMFSQDDLTQFWGYFNIVGDGLKFFQPTPEFSREPSPDLSSNSVMDFFKGLGIA